LGVDIFAFKNRKRESASRRVRRLLNRHCAGAMNPDERRGDTRVLYPQPACIIPLKDGKIPLLQQRATVFLCDLSGIGIGFFSHGAPRAQFLLLCLRDEDDEQFGGKQTSVFIKLRVCQSSPGEEGYTRTGCEILEEIQPTGRFAMLPLVFAAKPGVAHSGLPEPEDVPEVVQRMCSQPN
jgi:hypothetical protein